MSMTKLRMSELTAGEARQEMARNPVILLPMGSHEDQGPHAPMGDWILADAIAERIAARATERGTRTLMAPTLPFGGADYFGSMPGGIALGQATLRAVISDMLDCLLRHGLNRIVVINGHGGNVQAIHDATHPIWVERRILIPSLYLWRIGYSLLPGIVGPERAAKVSGHGADPLTSIGMHLFPGLIRADLVPEPLPRQHMLGLELTAFGVARFEGAEVAVPVEYHEVAPDGVRGGDPRLSSAETGAALVEQLTEIGARFVQHHASQTG
jgi:creatinine amidohydrolase